VSIQIPEQQGRIGRGGVGGLTTEGGNTMKSLAEAMQKAASGVATIGAKTLPNRPGWLGDAPRVAQQVDMGEPEADVSHSVGTLYATIVLPPANPDPEPYEGKWPSDNPDVAKAIHEVLVPSSRKDVA
jgi:hypothetical protein